MEIDSNNLIVELSKYFENENKITNLSSKIEMKFLCLDKGAYKVKLIIKPKYFK